MSAGAKLSDDATAVALVNLIGNLSPATIKRVSVGRDGWSDRSYTTVVSRDALQRLMAVLEAEYPGVINACIEGAKDAEAARKAAKNG